MTTGKGGSDVKRRKASGTALGRRTRAVRHWTEKGSLKKEENDIASFELWNRNWKKLCRSNGRS